MIIDNRGIETSPANATALGVIVERRFFFAETKRVVMLYHRERAA